MKKVEVLSDSEISKRLETLPLWSIQDDKLEAHLKFSTFVDAFSFMTRVAFDIEQKNHHPEWLNVYNKLTVKFTTHDSGGITEKDFEMAKIFSDHFSKFTQKGA